MAHATQIPKPPKSQILYLYRSLLRSSTYLPDSLSRVRIHNEITTRFRKRARRPANPDTLRTLQSWQKKLSRACDFHAKELEEILFLTYGRKGVRRRVLLDGLRSGKDGNVDGEEGFEDDDLSLQGFIEALEENPSRATNGKKDERRDKEGEKFQALLKSQKENLAQFERYRVKDLEPKIAKENIWGRDTPVKVVRNKEKEWLAKTLKKISPPVEEGEWERLRDLAAGDLVESAPVRRARREEEGVQEGKRGFEWEDMMGRIRGGEEERGEKILGKRGVRRLYGVIWAQTPKMSWDGVGKRWVVEWGREFQMTRKGADAVPRAVGREVELFEGVEELLEKMEKGGMERKGKKGKNVDGPRNTYKLNTES